MTERNGPHGKFLGCSMFPTCRGSISIGPDGKPKGLPADSETKAARMKVRLVVGAFAGKSQETWTLKTAETFMRLVMEAILGCPLRYSCVVSRMSRDECQKFLACFATINRVNLAAAVQTAEETGNPKSWETYSAEEFDDSFAFDEPFEDE
jgi:ssDNA-binding Zn-finger/Zn-ribbon topoisomerase 1